MPIWLLDAKSKFPNGTTFVLDCDVCASAFAFCDCDVKGDAPISEVIHEVASTDWEVVQSDKPGVTVKFICPLCQAERGDSGQVPLPDVTPELSSPLERMRAAGVLDVGSLKRWNE